MSLNVSENKFVLPIQIEKAGTVTKELQTKDTYVDKNIKIEVTTPDGELEVKKGGDLSASVSIDANVYTSDTETKYPITIKADAAITDVQVGVKTAGYVDSNDTATVTGSSAETDSKTVYIKAGSLSGSGTASAEGGNGITLGTKQTEAPETGYYVKASAAGGASVATAGWVDETTPSVSVNGDSYYLIDSATLANKSTDGKTYTEQAGPVLISGDYLYINKGYIGDTKISLADLVPDQANVAAGEDGNSNLIYKTVSVYDKNGALIAGTMGDATLAEIQAANVAGKISTVAVAANEDGSAFKVTGVGAISGDTSVAVKDIGYANTDLKATGTISGEAALEASLDKITVGATADNTTLTVTPVIVKDSSSAVATGDITTTAPTAGHYVAVSADAIAANTTVTPTVASAGYGTGTVFNANNVQITAGSNASGLYYVPITDASHVITKDTSAITAAAVTVDSVFTASNGGTVSLLTAAPEDGEYITISTSNTATKGSVTTNAKCTSTEGYITASTENFATTEEVGVGVTNAQNKYIKIYTGEVTETTV